MSLRKGNRRKRARDDEVDDSQYVMYKADGLFKFIAKNPVKAFTNALKIPLTLTRVLSRRSDMSAEVERNLLKFGTEFISSISVFRLPLSVALRKIIDALPGSNTKSFKHPLYHVFQIVRLQNGVILRIDKNETVEVERLTSDAYAKLVNTVEHIAVSRVPTTLSLETYIRGAEKMGKDMTYIYDPLYANCQLYVKWCLEGVNLWTPTIAAFAYQPEVPQLFSKVGWVQMKAITSTAGIVRNLLDTNGRF